MSMTDPEVQIAPKINLVTSCGVDYFSIKYVCLFQDLGARLLKAKAAPKLRHEKGRMRQHHCV